MIVGGETNGTVPRISRFSPKNIHVDEIQDGEIARNVIRQTNLCIEAQIIHYVLCR